MRLLSRRWAATRLNCDVSGRHWASKNRPSFGSFLSGVPSGHEGRASSARNFQYTKSYQTLPLQMCPVLAAAVTLTSRPSALTVWSAPFMPNLVWQGSDPILCKGRDPFYRSGRRTDVVQDLAIEFGVRQLHARNVDATWRKDAVQFAECFTKDAEWRIGGAILQGRDKIADTFAMLLGRVDGAFMQYGTPLLGKSDGGVIGRTYVVEYRFVGGEMSRSLGCYHEWFREEQGIWRFAKRYWSMIHASDAVPAGPMEAFSDFGAFPGMPPPDQPPQRPARTVFGLQLL
jgi:nuclear transport factor 2 (NTF2) superfamily protein